MVFQPSDPVKPVEHHPKRRSQIPPNKKHPEASAGRQENHKGVAVLPTGFGIGILITGVNYRGGTQHTDFYTGFTTRIFTKIFGEDFGGIGGTANPY